MFCLSPWTLNCYGWYIQANDLNLQSSQSEALRGEIDNSIVSESSINNSLRGHLENIQIYNENSSLRMSVSYEQRSSVFYPFNRVFVNNSQQKT